MIKKIIWWCGYWERRKWPALLAAYEAINVFKRTEEDHRIVLSIKMKMNYKEMVLSPPDKQWVDVMAAKVTLDLSIQKQLMDEAIQRVQVGLGFKLPSSTWIPDEA